MKLVAEKDIYEMKLHEVFCLDNETAQAFNQVLRVPGGWIYTMRTDDQHEGKDGVEFSKEHHHCVFVPFNNEYQESDTAPTGELSYHQSIAVHQSAKLAKEKAEDDASK